MEHLNKVIVIGDKGAGKTAFIMKAVHNTFTTSWKETMELNITIKVINDGNNIHKLQLWEIPGNERFAAGGNITKMYYEKTDGCFIILSLDNANTWDGALRWLDYLQTRANLSKNAPKYLIINKIDTVSSDDLIRMKFNEWFKSHGLKFSKAFMNSSKNIQDNQVSLQKIFTLFGREVLTFVNANPNRHGNDIITDNVIDVKTHPLHDQSKLDKENHYDKERLANTRANTSNVHSETSKKIDVLDADILEKYILFRQSNNADELYINKINITDSFFAATTVKQIGLQIILNYIISDIMNHPYKMQYKYNTKTHEIAHEHVIDSILKYLTGMGYKCETENGNGSCIIIINW